MVALRRKVPSGFERIRRAGNWYSQHRGPKRVSRDRDGGVCKCSLLQRALELSVAFRVAAERFLARQPVLRMAEKAFRDTACFCHCGGFAIERPARRLFLRKEAE